MQKQRALGLNLARFRGPRNRRLPQRVQNYHSLRLNRMRFRGPCNRRLPQSCNYTSAETCCHSAHKSMQPKTAAPACLGLVHKWLRGPRNRRLPHKSAHIPTESHVISNAPSCASCGVHTTAPDLHEKGPCPHAAQRSLQPTVAAPKCKKEFVRFRMDIL